MELKPGCKMTEVGVIPEDWEVKQLKEIAEVTSGKRLPAGYSLVKDKTSHPYIRVSDMYPGGISMDNIMYVPVNIATYIKNYRIYIEDIFISVAGTLGIVGQIPKELNGSNLTENADKITKITCYDKFLVYILLSDIIQKVIATTRTIGAQPKLALDRIRNFFIPLPPALSEQQAIAAALSDVDELLSSLDQLIAKKKDIRLATMHELLTGKTRLPGFSETWQKKTLGELGFFIKGKGISRAEANSGSIPCIRYGEIYTHHNNIVKKFHSFISHEAAQKSIRLKTGDILFTCSGETKEDIGKSVAFTSGMEAYAGGDIIILRNTTENSNFLGYRLNASDISLQKSSAGQGDAVVHISSTSLSNICVTLPSTHAEQQAIASVLSDMDDEIEALEARRDKVRHIKAGMMQELLTGKTRLISSGEEA